MSPSVQTLSKIAFAVGGITAGTGWFLQYKLRQRITQKPYYLESFKILKANQGNIFALKQLTIIFRPME